MKRFGTLVLAITLLSACSTEAMVQPTIITENAQLESETSDGAIHYTEEETIVLPEYISFSELRGETAFFIKDNQTWKMNIYDQKPEFASSLPVRYISEDASVAIAFEEEDHTSDTEITVVRLQDDKQTSIGILDNFSIRFLQNNIIASFLYDQKTEKQSLALIDAKTGERNDHDLSEVWTSLQGMLFAVAERTTDYYTMATSDTAPTVFTHVKKDGTQVPLIEDIEIHDSTLLKNGNFIISGTIKNNSGIFLYHTKKNTLHLLANYSESGYMTFYNISPDETIILFTTKSDIEHKKNIYAANLTDNGIINTTQIIADVHSPDISWDDKTAYISFANNMDTYTVGKMATLSVKPITFTP